ncbi:MAG: sugar hydrolase [Massilia sp.]|nr:sugar hydrolase [Massilia sp.]
MRQKFKTLHIKTLFAGSLGVVLAMSGTAAADTKASSAYLAVDPMIGTGGDGHTYPGATTPFGMIQLSPDTEQTNFKKSYKWAAGYQYDDSSILGFSHTHFSGSGHSDLGDVLLMPISGEVKLDPGTPNVPRSGYRSQFSHASEQAEAGYYSVTLSDYDTRVELTASSRIGWHRYTFPAGKPAHVLLDMRPSIYDYDGKVLWSQVRVHEDGTITGYRETRGWAPGRQLYFAMRFSAPMVKHELIDRETEKTYKGFKGPGTSPADTSEVQSKALEAVFDFGTLKSPLLVKVAISAVSEANALGNLEHDAVGWDFDGQRAQARKAWEAALSAVDVDAPAAMRRSFYTALYHAMLAPNLAMDANGDYRGPDHQVHHAKDFSFYSTWSTWDTFRAEHPLITIVQPPQRTNDFVHSLIAAQQASPYGILPVWAYQGLETWCMIGYHSVPIIADAYMKGIRGYPVEDALKAMIASATYAPYGGLDAYMKLGYVPIDKEPEAASKTLEYAFDDWTLAQMARASGHKDVAEKFEKRAANWRNVFDPVTGFVRAKKTDGSFNTPFDPAAVGYGSDYTEGNAWQYSWFAPQDIAGLTRELGGTNKFLAKLDAVFDTKVDLKAFAHVEDISGLIGYYAHGNEPSHHIAYLYNYAGAPWRTQERLKQIMDSQYSTTPTGLAGNDDLGQMSAWFVFTAMGFYPVAPGSNQYVIGRPFVNRATINLPNGKHFTMVAEHLDEAHPYVGRVSLNGKPLDHVYIRHQDIEAGGELRFEMQSKPNKDWGRALNSRPFSMSGYGS